MKVLECVFGNSSTPSVPISVVLFEVVLGGRLEIDGITLKHSEFDNISAIKAVERNLVIKNSLFENVKMTLLSLMMVGKNGDSGGSGVVVMEIEKCIFSQVVLLNGNGAVVNAIISNRDILKIYGVL
jgi:hypothetical protein